MANTKTQIDRFIAKYSPAVAVEFRAARALVSTYFPRGHELVYDNYNALGCGFSTTLTASGVVVSVVAYPKWVTLFFFEGTSLPDPEKMLQGSGPRIRSLRLQPFAVLHSKAVSTLLRHATTPVRKAMALGPTLTTLIRSVSVKQRPRRPVPAKAKHSTAPRRKSRAAQRGR